MTVLSSLRSTDNRVNFAHPLISETLKNFYFKIPDQGICLYPTAALPPLYTAIDSYFPVGLHTAVYDTYNFKTMLYIIRLDLWGHEAFLMTAHFACDVGF